MMSLKVLSQITFPAVASEEHNRRLSITRKHETAEKRRQDELSQLEKQHAEEKLFEAFESSELGEFCEVLENIKGELGDDRFYTSRRYNSEGDTTMYISLSMGGADGSQDDILVANIKVSSLGEKGFSYTLESTDGRHGMGGTPAALVTKICESICTRDDCQRVRSLIDETLKTEYGILRQHEVAETTVDSRQPNNYS